MKLSRNDLAFLRSVATVGSDYDGCIVYGAAQWTAARRLVRAGLVRWNGSGVCGWDDCPRRADEHTHRGVAITPEGTAIIGRSEEDATMSIADYAETLRDNLDLFMHHGKAHSHRVAVLSDPDPSELDAVILVERVTAQGDAHPVVCETLCTSVASAAKAAALKCEWEPWGSDGFVRVGLPWEPWGDANDLIAVAIACGGPR